MKKLGVLLGLITALCSSELHNTKYDKQIQSAVTYYWIDFPKWKYYKAQLYQESLLDSKATSHVGAKGLAQFMPSTWLDMQRELRIPKWVTPYIPSYSIKAGAYYMRKLRNSWTWNRPIEERHYLALASYNAGLGNILKAQKECKENKGRYILWEDISKCLPLVTGENAKETIQYVIRIQRWEKKLK